MVDKNYLKARAGKNASHFGRIVAEQDPELHEYYVDADRYVARALDPNDPAVFFVGPKGAGKSAILQMVRLTRSIDSSRIISISPDDLAFSALTNVRATTPILSEFSKHQWLFKSLWDYILSLEVLRREFKDRNTFSTYLLNLLRSLLGTQRDAEARRLLLVSLGDEGQAMSLSSRILQLINEVELSADVSDVAKVSGKAKIDTSKGTQGSQLWLLSLINTVAKKMGETVNAPYHILIDDLDLHWHDTPIQNAFIAALFFSLRNFNKPPNLKCSVAIRDRIFRRLPLVDRDKYHDWICHVEWQEANVRTMVERRITKSIDIQPKDIWGGLFPHNSFSRMLRHTYGRPREVIRLCSMCVAEAVKKSHLQVKDEDIDSAIQKFSDSRITEVASEFSFQHTGLDHIIRKFKGWQKEFTAAKLTEVAEDVWLEKECGDDMAAEYAWAAEYREDPVGLTRILLECNILLYKPDRSSAPVLYDPDKRPDIQAGTWIAVHPAFFYALEMERPSK